MDHLSPHKTTTRVGLNGKSHPAQVNSPQTEFWLCRNAELQILQNPSTEYSDLLDKHRALAANFPLSRYPNASQQREAKVIELHRVNKVDLLPVLPYKHLLESSGLLSLSPPAHVEDLGRLVEAFASRLAVSVLLP